LSSGGAIMMPPPCMLLVLFLLSDYVGGGLWRCVALQIPASRIKIVSVRAGSTDLDIQILPDVPVTADEISDVDAASAWDNVLFLGDAVAYAATAADFDLG
jgi:hypothetical protein